MGKIFLICTIKPNIEFVRRKFNPIDLFCHIDARVFAILCEKKWVFFFLFFLNVFSYQGERFLQNFWCQQAKNRARRAKMDPKIDTFGQFDTRDLAILGVKKIVFWTFSKFF